MISSLFIDSPCFSDYTTFRGQTMQYTFVLKNKSRNSTMRIPVDLNSRQETERKMLKVERENPGFRVEKIEYPQDSNTEMKEALVKIISLANA